MNVLRAYAERGRQVARIGMLLGVLALASCADRTNNEAPASAPTRTTVSSSLPYFVVTCATGEEVQWMSTGNGFGFRCITARGIVGKIPRLTVSTTPVGDKPNNDVLLIGCGNQHTHDFQTTLPDIRYEKNQVDASVRCPSGEVPVMIQHPSVQQEDTTT